MENDKNLYAVGIDIGGTNSVIGLLDRQGHIIKRETVPTTGHSDVRDFVAALATRIKGLIPETGAEVVGIGIGAPCANGRTGEIEAATDLPWPSPIPLVDLMEKASGLPVIICNDANAAAMGEMAYGAARGIKDFILITLGTGVGSGIVCDGHLLEGYRGFAGELGHVRAWRNEGRQCACGRPDCLQTYCSAKGVVATALKLMRDGADSRLREIPEGQLTSRDVAEAAAEGDATAIETLRFTGEVLGESCAEFAAFSNPEAIVLFGGVSKAGEPLTSAMTEAFERNTLSLFKGKTQFLMSALKESDAALLGAGALGWEAARKRI